MVSEEYRRLRLDLLDEMVRTLTILSERKQLTAEKRWEVLKTYQKRMADLKIEDTKDISEYHSPTTD